jgi:hypothetical protein
VRLTDLKEYDKHRKDKFDTSEEFDSALEAFRVSCIQELLERTKEIEKLSADLLGMKGYFEIAGSVLNRQKFTENSDVDGIYYVSTPTKPKGILDKETQKLQIALLKVPFKFGILNIGVINDY